jgi:hypothetical protein
MWIGLKVGHVLNGNSIPRDWEGTMHTPSFSQHFVPTSNPFMKVSSLLHCSHNQANCVALRQYEWTMVGKKKSEDCYLSFFERDEDCYFFFQRLTGAKHPTQAAFITSLERNYKQVHQEMKITTRTCTFAKGPLEKKAKSDQVLLPPLPPDRRRDARIRPALPPSGTHHLVWRADVPVDQASGSIGAASLLRWSSVGWQSTLPISRPERSS